MLTALEGGKVMALSLLCLLEALIGFAIICLVLWILWWAFTSLIAAFGVTVPAQVLVILKVIAVLILVVLLVRALLTGEWCGWLGIARLR